MKVTKIVLTIGFCLLTIPAVAQEVREGKLYDPGITMTAPAETAAPELAKAAYLIGQWDVKAQLQGQNGPVESSGKASITYMNRGHSIMLRMAIPGLYGEDGDSHSISFLSFQGGQNNWLLGNYDSFRESIRIYNGTYQDDALVVSTSNRAYGSTLVFTYRITMKDAGENKAQMVYEVMNNRDQKWSTVITMDLAKRQPSDDFMPVRDDFGVPSPDRPEQAKQFDFLIGEYNAHQTLIRPQAGNLEFDSTTTAVYVCNGTAILEFLWHGNDPNLPDEGTSVIRAYNRSQRQWESLFHTNRGDAQLHFGGVQEGNEIVLHQFEADSFRPMNMWVFHNISEKGYDWYGQRSFDRGKTWQKGWIIRVREKK